MFEWFFELLASVLAAIYEVVPNYAVAIAGLTFVVMIITTPLTLKGTRSMMEMQALQPKLREIQNRNKDDRTKAQEETMAFYKEHSINPLGGCIPLLVQMPVFLVLFNVVRGLTRKVGGDFAAQMFGGPADPTFSPQHLDESTSLFTDLAKSTQMNAFGLDFSVSANNALGDSIITGLPYLVLVLGVMATSFITQRQIAGRGTGASNPQQQMLLKVMPVFFAFISLQFAAALVIYLLVSNLYRLGQQAYITKSLYGGELGEQVREAGKDLKKQKDSGVKGSGPSSIRDALKEAKGNASNAKGGSKGRNINKSKPGGGSTPSKPGSNTSSKNSQNRQSGSKKKKNKKRKR